MSTDALGRRLRFAPPAPRVDRLVLQPNDHLVFEAIERHGPLPTHYLYEFLNGSKSLLHFKHRLTELYNGDKGGPYLLRPPQQFAGFEARYQHLVYDLAPRAHMVLGTVTSRRTDPFLHQLMTACVGACLELGAPSHGVGYVGRSQILANAHPNALAAKNPMELPLPGVAQRSLIPDDLCGLRFPDGWTRHCAIEIDRNTESIERTNLGYNTIGKKIAGYVETFERKLYRSWWAIDNFGVLIVTTNARHARNILDYIGKRVAPRWANRFALQVAPDFGANWRVPKAVLTHLLNAPWRAVSGDKDICRR